MKTESFGELLGSMKEALKHAGGKRNLRTTTLPLPPAPLNGRAVKRVRAALHASQAVFARYLNVSTKLVQAWEADRRAPEGPALVLLHMAAEKPELLEAIRHESQGRPLRATKVTRPRQRRKSHSAAAQSGTADRA